jgi:hypothetical protein
MDIRRRFNAIVTAKDGETEQQAHERTKQEINETGRRDLELSDEILYGRGWDFLLGFAAYPEKPWNEAHKTSFNGVFENPAGSETERECQEPALRFCGYASEKNFGLVKMLQQPGQEAGTPKPFILLEVNLDGNQKTMHRELDQTVAYLRRTFDHVQEGRGEARRFAKTGRRRAGGSPGFEPFVRSLNAMRVLSGAKHLGLQHGDLSDLISDCGFSPNIRSSKGGQRYTGVETATAAQKEFVALFRRSFGKDAVPLTISDPAGTLSLKV